MRKKIQIRPFESRHGSGVLALTFDFHAALTLLPYNMIMLDNPLLGLLALIAAYLLGSVPFAIISSKLFGLKDPRSYGSGNPGATNVLRSGSKGAALLTLLGDGFKGWFAVWLAIQYQAGPWTLAAVCVAVFLGHLYPIFLGFKGGKGVATALGVLLAISGWLGLAAMLTWVIVVYFFRISSLAAIASALFAPFYYIIASGTLWSAQASLTLAIAFMSLMLLYRHRANLSRIIKGTEPRLGKKSVETGNSRPNHPSDLKSVRTTAERSQSK